MKRSGKPCHYFSYTIVFQICISFSQIPFSFDTANIVQNMKRIFLPVPDNPFELQFCQLVPNVCVRILLVFNFSAYSVLCRWLRWENFLSVVIAITLCCWGKMTLLSWTGRGRISIALLSLCSMYCFVLGTWYCGSSGIWTMLCVLCAPCSAPYL